ncbi:MAG: hypothetical protein RIR88_4 [Actinomycetota bacterium]
MSDFSDETVTENPAFFKAPKDYFPDVVVDVDTATPPTPAVQRVPTNRGPAVLIALAGGVLFSLLYILAASLYNWASWTYGNGGGASNVADFIQTRTVAFLATPVYWITAIAFTVYFALLALIFNKAVWRTYVIAGFVVALLTYVTAIGAGLFTVHAWTLSFGEAVNFTWRGIAFNPLVLVTIVLAREIPIWFGGWIAIRGKKFRSQP